MSRSIAEAHKEDTWLAGPDCGNECHYFHLITAVIYWLGEQGRVKAVA